MWINTVYLGRRVLSGGHLRLESSCVQVSSVLTVLYTGLCYYQSHECRILYECTISPQEKLLECHVSL
jgi:Golgi nucleoside diphosphatase